MVLRLYPIWWKLIQTHQGLINLPTIPRYSDKKVEIDLYMNHFMDKEIDNRGITTIRSATSILVTDVGDEICWRQL